MINWLILHHVSSDICLILKDLCINITYSPIQPLNIIYNFNNFSVYNGIFIFLIDQHYFLCLCILWYYIVIIIVIIVIVIVEHIPWFWYLPTVPLTWMTPWWNARPQTWAGCCWLTVTGAGFCVIFPSHHYTAVAVERVKSRAWNEGCRRLREVFNHGEGLHLGLSFTDKYMDVH